MSVMAKKINKNRPRAIPVACAERKVYFRKGAGQPETDTLCHNVLFKLLFILIVAMLSPQNPLCKDRTHHTLDYILFD